MAEPNHSALVADTAYIHQCVYDMRTHELQTVLEAVKHNKSGSKTVLRKRILNLLSASAARTRVLRQKIVSLYKSRPQNTHHIQQQLPVVLPPYHHSGPQNQSQNLLQYFRLYPSNNYPSSSNTTQPYDPLQPMPSLQPSPTAEFEDLPFFQPKETLLNPMYCQNNVDSANFSGLFYLSDSVRHSIVKSWIIAKQEYKVQIILRFVQIGLQDNITERLPYNITVSVNDRSCKLPTLNIPTKAGITPWRCNVPIDITQQTDLRNCLQNTLKISWSNEPHEYMAAVYVAEKLTWCELLVDLKKRPLRAADKTKEIIKISMEDEYDMGVDSMVSSIKDPLSKTKMELPARGKDCVHLQCFDAIQFLQMNEQKQTWSCPLCKKKVKFDNIEIDEFFLNIFQSPDLSKDCESIVLFEDGSWSEKKPINYSNVSNLNSNGNTTKNNIEVFTLSDSDDDDDDVPPAKCSKLSPPPTIEEMLIKSEHISCTAIEDSTQTTGNNSTEDTVPPTVDINSTENDLALDLSLKNNSSPKTYLDDQAVIITLNDDSEEMPALKESPHMLTHLNLPSITLTQNNNKDCKPSNSKKKTKNKHIEKHIEKQKSKTILTITLD